MTHTQRWMIAGLVLAGLIAGLDGHAQIRDTLNNIGRGVVEDARAQGEQAVREAVEGQTQAPVAPAPAQPQPAAQPSTSLFDGIRFIDVIYGGAVLLAIILGFCAMLRRPPPVSVTDAPDEPAPAVTDAQADRLKALCWLFIGALSVGAGVEHMEGRWPPFATELNQIHRYLQVFAGALAGTLVEFGVIDRYVCRRWTIVGLATGRREDGMLVPLEPTIRAVLLGGTMLRWAILMYAACVVIGL